METWRITDSISHFITSNPTRNAQSLRNLDYLKRDIKEATVEDLDYIIDSFLQDAQFYARPNNIWVLQILRIILDRPESLSIMNSKEGLYKDIVDRLLNPLIKNGVLLPRELDNIEHNAFSERELRRLIGSYTEDEKLRDIGEERLRPYRALQKIHPIFSVGNVSDIVGGYSGYSDYGKLDVPLYTPRIHRPIPHISPHISPHRSPHISPHRSRGRSPNRKTSSVRSKPRRSRR